MRQGAATLRTESAFFRLCLMALSASGAEENDPGATDGAMPPDRVIERMETAVPSSTWDAYRREHTAPFWLFGEDRRFAVRNDIIPAHWFNLNSSFHFPCTPLYITQRRREAEF